MPEDLGDKGMAEEMATVAHHTSTRKRQPQATSELFYHQPNQPSQQDYAAKLSSTDSRPRLRNCWQKNRQVLDQAGAQYKQTFNSRAIMEKHLKHQLDLFHNFIDFKKAFGRVQHAGLWQVLTSFNIAEN